MKRRKRKEMSRISWMSSGYQNHKAGIRHYHNIGSNCRIIHGKTRICGFAHKEALHHCWCLASKTFPPRLSYDLQLPFSPGFVRLKHLSKHANCILYAFLWFKDLEITIFEWLKKTWPGWWYLLNFWAVIRLASERSTAEHSPTFRNSCALRRLMMQKATATCQGCDSLDHIEGSRNYKLWACTNPLCAGDNMQQARTMQAQFHRVCLHHIEVCTLIHAYVQLIHANSYLYVYQYNNRNDPYISCVIISRCGSLRCIWKPI